MSALPPTFVPGFHDEEFIKKMVYKQLGNTDLIVSKLSLGTGGFSYFYGDYDIEECKKTVHEAIKRGINFIDTAPWYGHGVSEEILGKCLEDIPRKAYYLATKVGRYEKDPKNMFDFSAAKVVESIDVSLTRLGLDYVDLIQIHDIEFAPSQDMIINETLPAVKQIVDSGKARYIGITGYPPAKLIQCIEKSNIKIDSVLSYCRLSMIDQSLNNFLTILKKRKIGVINAAVNSMGLLSSNGAPEWHPASEKLKSLCKEIAEHCQKNSVEIGKLAVYYGLIQNGVDTTLVGMNNVKLLNYNTDVLFNGINDNELRVYKQVLKFIESKLDFPSHWENVELENYWSIMKGEDK